MSEAIEARRDAVSDAIDALRAQAQSEPDGSAPALLVDALRRAGRLHEALEAGAAAAESAPERLETRAALALLMLELDDAAAAREELERGLSALEAPLEAGPASEEPALRAEPLEEPETLAQSEPPEALLLPDPADEAAGGHERADGLGEEIAAEELDEAFGAAQPEEEQMWSADDVAQRAVVEALGDGPEMEDAGPAAADPDRERVLATLETWLRNIRRAAA